MEKVCILIDSANFYHLVLKKLNIQEIDFDFGAFTKFLVGEREIIEEGKRFYVATVRENHESKQAMSNQTRLFTMLLNEEEPWQIKTSKLRTRIEEIKIDKRVTDYQKLLNLGITEIEYKKSREKGIDVKIATDLIIGAVDKKYDTAILISSDTDLVPAIDVVRNRFHKKVEYVGFSMPKNNIYDSTEPSNRMIKKTDIKRVLIEADVKPFIRKNLFNK